MVRKASFFAGIVALAVAAGALSAPAAGSTLIAPPAVCANSTLDAPIQAQEQAMHCMTDFARRQVGLGGLATAKALAQSSYRKARDVLRCNDFSHSACGRDFTYWMQRSGYTSSRCWRAGENLAWGVGERGTVRSIFQAWVRSPSHRRNILSRFSHIGIGLRVGTLANKRSTRVWTQHFGSHCGQHSRATPTAKRNIRLRSGLTPARAVAARSGPLAQ